MSLRAPRACLVCSYVQAGSKFARDGCPNCEEFLEMRNNQDVVFDCTSQVFEGLITLNAQGGSWVAKWQRLEGYQPGTYAIKVVGSLPDDFVAAAENAGVKYIPLGRTLLPPNCSSMLTFAQEGWQRNVRRAMSQVLKLNTAFKQQALDFKVLIV